MMRAAVQIVVSSIDTTLYRVIEQGGRTYIYGTVAWDGRTVDFAYEGFAGEYGGSTLTFKPEQPEPVDDVVYDLVTEECSQIIFAAIQSAVLAFEDAVAAQIEKPRSEEVELDD